MQTPAGFHIVGEGLAARAEITDFLAMVFNPSSMDRLSHVLMSAWHGWRGALFSRRWLLWCFVFAVLGPQLANQLGWFAAEVGRQPWIVYHLLRTSDGLSKTVGTNAVLASLIMFTLIYALIFALFVFLLDDKIRRGPEEKDTQDVYRRQTHVVRA